MSTCQTEFDAMQDALVENGRDSREYEESRERYQACLIQEGEMARARQSHGAAWDEKLFQLQRDIQAAREKLFYGLKVPPGPTCGRNSIEARSKIFGNKRNAMIFSEKMEEAFGESGVKLADDETYACLVCVVKKPEYVSEALTLNPLLQNIGGTPRVNYILEPAIMESVMNTIEQDAINYESKVKK